MINLKSVKTRVTWRLAPDVHTKLNKISGTAGLSLEEVANLLLQAVEWDDVKAHVQRYRQDKKKAEQRRKQATDAVAQLDPQVLEALAGLSPEEIAKRLSS